MHNFLTKLTYQKAMLGPIEWWVQNGPVTKDGVLPVTTVFFWKFCFSLRTSYKDLIWCNNDPNTQTHSYFLLAGVLFDGAFSLWVSLKNIYFQHLEKPYIMASSKTWTQTLKNLDPGISGTRKTWILKNME